MSETIVLPLFPLETVLFPNMPLPLHIFEPCYKKMIGKCIDSEQDFGIVLKQSCGMAKVGTTACIENVLQTYDDGRLNILTLGKTRFTVEEIIDSQPYLQAKVQYWTDEDSDKDLEQLLCQLKTLIKIYAKLTGKISDVDMIENYTPFSFSFFLAELNMYPLTKKQLLLEMHSTKERLELGLCSLQNLVKRMELDQKLQKLLDSRQTFFNIFN